MWENQKRFQLCGITWVENVSKTSRWIFLEQWHFVLLFSILPLFTASSQAAHNTRCVFVFVVSTKIDFSAISLISFPRRPISTTHEILFVFWSDHVIHPIYQMMKYFFAYLNKKLCRNKCYVKIVMTCTETCCRHNAISGNIHADLCPWSTMSRENYAQLASVCPLLVSAIYRAILTPTLPTIGSLPTGWL